MDYRQYIQNVPDFPKPGIMFRDVTPLLVNPVAFNMVAADFASEWSHQIDVIVGLDARGFIFGGALALVTRLPFVPVRKKGKLPSECDAIEYDLEYGSATLEMQKGSIKPGQRVLVIDDLLATGGTAKAACSLVEKQGGVVVGCAFVIELDGLGGRKALEGYPIQSLVRYEKPIYTADAIAKYGEDSLVIVERLSSVPGLALPGGKKEPGDSIPETIVLEMEQETGLVFEIESEFGTYDEPGRDPRGNYISTVFVGRATGTLKDESEKTRALILPIAEYGKWRERLVFDHAKILDDYFASL